MNIGRFRDLNPYQLHTTIINDYVLNKSGASKSLQDSTVPKVKRDCDVIRKNHRFLWTEEDNVDTWEQRLAKKYYDKLFKEYCICDLTCYKDNKIALRWRTEKEVVTGKGHFSCANKYCTICDCDNLKTWEVNFAYVEDNQRKNALVKIRLCPECSLKLNYKTQKRQVKRLKKAVKKNKNKDMQLESIGDNRDSKDDGKDEECVVSNDQQFVDLDEDLDKIWDQQTVDDTEKSREEVFEQYLNDLFL